MTGKPDNQVQYLKLDGPTYMALRQYLGTRPHDDVHQLVRALEGLPVVTVAGTEYPAPAVEVAPDQEAAE